MAYTLTRNPQLCRPIATNSAAVARKCKVNSVLVDTASHDKPVDSGKNTLDYCEPQDETQVLGQSEQKTLLLGPSGTSKGRGMEPGNQKPMVESGIGPSPKQDEEQDALASRV